MICEYKRNESGAAQNEDSSNSSSSTGSSSSSAASAPPTSFAGICRKDEASTKRAIKRKAENKLIDKDLYENEESEDGNTNNNNNESSISSTNSSCSSSDSESEAAKKKKTEMKEKTDKKKKKKKDKKKKLYCICKSADTERFMIACDKCDEWYHGDCVGVSQSLSKKIKAFFCHVCRVKRPSLAIKYKSKFEEFLKNPSKFLLSNPGESIYLKFQKEIKV